MRGSYGVALRRGYEVCAQMCAARLRSNVLVFTILCDACSRFVETKWSVASVFAVKHNGFSTFSIQNTPEPPMATPASQELPRCLPDASLMSPRCFPDASQIPDAPPEASHDIQIPPRWLLSVKLSQMASKCFSKNSVWGLALVSFFQFPVYIFLVYIHLTLGVYNPSSMSRFQQTQCPLVFLSTGY